jgi:hypothetical protein
MNTLEYYALEYMGFIENFVAYNYIFVLIGAVIGGFWAKVDYKMKRSTYFLNTSFAVCLVSLAQIVWLLFVKAVATGLLPLLVAVDVILWIAFGYAIMLLGKARAIDAFGTTKSAFLAFIPIANLWLLFSPTKEQTVETGSGLHVGGTAILFGFVLLALGRGGAIGLEDALQNGDFANVSVQDTEAIREKYFLHALKRDGLDAALRYLASLDQAQAGARLDEITVLEEISVKDAAVVYQYLITDNEIVSFDRQWLANIQRNMCSEFEFAIGRGAAIKLLYYSKQRGTLAEVIVSETAC